MLVEMISHVGSKYCVTCAPKVAIVGDDGGTILSSTL